MVRGDLDMPPGKLAAQAGHAFVETLKEAQANYDNGSANGESYNRYRAERPGTKVVLLARNIYELERARDECAMLGIPHALVVDSGHVLPPHFDGNPIVTALGFGPATRSEVGRITRRLALVP